MKAMRALFTVLPAESHFGPALPLAEELVKRDWEVAFAGSPAMKDRVQSRGFEFFPVGLDWLEAEAVETFPELRSMPLDEQATWWVSDIFADRAAKPAATDLVEVIQHWAPRVVVRDYWDFGAWAAAEAQVILTAVVGLAMFTTEDEFGAFIGPQLQDLRAHVGLKPDEQLRSLYTGPYVDLLPASYQINRPPNVVHMTPVAAYSDGDFQWVPPQPDSPTVLVTFGTVFNWVPGVFETVIEALADEPVNVVVTTGLNRDPASLEPLPDNTHAERFIPYSALLPRCDAVVCHAGFGTTMAGLAYDLPIAALPLSADQFVHARRCEQLGVGRVVPYADRTPSSVRQAVTEVLNATEIRQRAARLGNEIRSMPGPQRAADVLREASRRQ
ncbi:MAG: hypothetical protein KY429_00845 [Actinobacteria bacterium]|nr:hypothetical protein [Actinomycetota bacterium]